jgi:hypothetical protein
MRRLLLMIPLLVLALAAPAHAGGWATTALSSTPDGGRTWTVDLTILQHGRTPLSGVEPRIVIRDDSGAERRFAAKPTARVGVYRASVVFPRPGRWEYTVYNGFDDRPQAYPAVTIGDAPVRTSGLPALAWVLGAAGVILLLGSGAMTLRGRTRSS